MNRAWAEKSAVGLAAADRAAGPAALLAAFAPYQLTKDDVQALNPSGDEALVAATSWASMAAARRVGARLHVPS
jgi:hypothetical protein